MKTERIDFQTLSDGKVIANKMHRSEDKRWDVVHSSEVKDNGFSLDDALAWCEANRYMVLWWWDEHKRRCARAFLGEPWLSEQCTKSGSSATRSRRSGYGTFVPILESGAPSRSCSRWTWPLPDSY